MPIPLSLLPALLAPPAIAGEPASAAEPLVVAVANVKGDNAQARAVAEAIGGSHADLVVILECSRKSLAADTLEAEGLGLLLDARDPSPWGVCIAGRLEAETRVVPAPWSGPCLGPVGVARMAVGSGFVAALGVHLPPRLPECEGTTDVAIAALAAWVKDGKLAADVGPAHAGDPVVLLGDFNTDGKKLSPLRAVGLAETGEKAGVKLVTWSAGPLKAWFDHIFIPAAWAVESTVALDLPGSDHRGVVATILPEE